MSKRPISRVYTGKPGRPAQVKALTEGVIAAALTEWLRESRLIALGIPSTHLRTESAKLAAFISERLSQADLRVIPASVCRELALIVGEPSDAQRCVAPMAGETQTSQPTNQETE